MSGSVTHIPSSPEVRRLRQLVGIERAPMKDNSAAVEIESSSTPATDRPNSDELLSLLQKQDGVMSELFRELETCKSEIKSLKKDSAGVANENRRLFDELRSQISHQSVSKSVAAFPVGLQSISEGCPACQKLQERLAQQKKEKNAAQERIANLESQVESAHKRDLEAFGKVREAVDVAEKASASLSEAEIKIKNLEEKLKLNETEFAEARKDHKNALSACRDTVSMEYRTELEIAQKQIEKLETEVKTLQRDADISESRRRELQAEKEELRKALRDSDSEYKQNVGSLRSQLESHQSEKQTLAGDNRALLHKLDIMESLHKQKMDNLAEKCAHVSAMLEESKKEVSESRERWVQANEHKNNVEKQLILSNQEIKRLKSVVNEVKLQADRDIELAKLSNLEIEGKSRFDLEDLTAKQNDLVTKLKEECASLTQELASKTKQQKKNLKVLSREKQHLATKLEKAQTRTAEVSSDTSV